MLLVFEGAPALAVLPATIPVIFQRALQKDQGTHLLSRSSAVPPASAPVILQGFHHPRSLITGTDPLPSSSTPGVTSPTSDAATLRPAPAAPPRQRVALSTFLLESDPALPAPSAATPRAPSAHER